MTMIESNSKKIALLDFDSVIYEGFSVFDIIQAQEKDGFIQSGVWRKVAEQIDRYKKQDATYKEAADKMLEAWAIGLKGKSYQDAVYYVQDYFKTHPEKFFKWFEQSQPYLYSHDIFIITANYQFIAEAIVSKFNLQGYISSEAEVKEGLFSGLLGKSLAGNKGDVSTLLKRYPHEGSIAVGDSENDVDMLEIVEFPVCFQPDEKLRAIATSRDWLIVDESSASEHLRKILT